MTRARVIRVIAVDGPAGTGKSTTARRVAEALEWRHVDSGAFYRVAALLALRRRLDPGAPGGREALREALTGVTVEQERRGGRSHTMVDGEDVTDAIRSPAVDAIVSRVADDPGLREIVNEALRRSVGPGPAVVDGRDIGTVVFPDAALKVYLDASLAERARRRALQVEPPERAADAAVLASYEASLSERDRADRARPAGALAAADDAVHVDTSHLDLEAQVARVLHLARSVAAPPKSG